MYIRNRNIRKRHIRARRRGISLLEVLMSIFIIMIGILGVASLLPLATHLANRGTTADRAAIAGKEALRQFAIREMNNPDNWLQSDGTPFSLATQLDTNNPPVANKPLQPGGPKAYCLDPRLIARNNAASAFPVGAGVAMPRITLRNRSGGAAGGGVAMGTLAADDVFMLQDDLEYALPDDTIQPPVQIAFGDDNGTPTNPNDDPSRIKRFFAGDFSWLATLVREAGGDRYTLSVVVLRGRHNPAAADEITIPAGSVAMPGGGIGGGEITIDFSSAGLSAAQLAQANENLAPGRWVLLAGQESSGAVRAFRWYRILHLSDVDTTTSPATRHVTLAGRDWDVALLGTPQVTILPGVVAAYERTVRLETSTLWQR